MLQINDNTDELIIGEGNETNWVSSFVLFICAIIGGYYVLSLEKENAMFWIAVSGINALFLIFHMIVNPGTTVRLNKKSRLLSIEKKGLFKNSLKFYPFREIAEPICSQAIKNAKGDDDYEFIMRLKSGEEIKFLDYAASTSEIFNAANFMNDVIFDSPEKVRFKSSAFNEIAS